MDKLQAWVGLIGIGLLLFDRFAGYFGWHFGQTSSLSALRKDVDQIRKDVDTINERGSVKNGELQRVIGHLEISIVECRKDCEAIRRELDGIARRHQRDD